MVQTGVFFKPQRRKANEGVRISHLDPETRMNSRDEFRQGTNIMMRAMRGVGVWGGEARLGDPTSNINMENLEGGGRLQCSLCHQVIQQHHGELGGGRAASMQSLSPGMEGPRSSATVANFKTRCAARRPFARCLPGPGNRRMWNCQKKREISARRGSRTRRRGSVMPLRGNLFKTILQFSYV